VYVSTYYYDDECALCYVMLCCVAIQSINSGRTCVYMYVHHTGVHVSLRIINELGHSACCVCATPLDTTQSRISPSALIISTCNSIYSQKMHINFLSDSVLICCSHV
jgi:hypothetical protein